MKFDRLAVVLLALAALRCSASDDDEVDGPGTRDGGRAPNGTAADEEAGSHDDDDGGDVEDPEVGLSEEAGGGDDDASSDSDADADATDAGYDGGKPDTGAPDAGIDAGRDAGAQDAGTDAGRDAGAQDAGTDAGRDAGRDAGAPGVTETVHFMGRFDRSNPIAPRFDWSGSAFTANFTGTGIALNLKDSGDNWFEVEIDSAPPTVFRTTNPTTHVTLASGLAPGEHRVYVHKRTEANFSTVQFLGFDVEGGALIATSRPTPRRMEIIGDSITAGYGNEGVSPCNFSGATENHYRTYGAITARDVNAELTTVAWSGRGVTRNYDGDTNGLLPALYEQTIGKEATPWSWETPADVVVINMGSNDFNLGDPGQPFVTAYSNFVQLVRSHHPSAWIFVAFGTTQGSATAISYLNQVVTARQNAGDNRISFIEFQKQQPADGYGCGGHPSLVTHGKMATLLTTAVRERLGW